MIVIMKNNLKNHKNIVFLNKAVKDKKGFVYVDEKGDISSNQTSLAGEKSVECVTLDDDIKERKWTLKAMN